jgi:hypothetical protein
MWMWNNLILISKEKLASTGNERFLDDTEFLIPWIPNESFALQLKKDKERYSKSLKRLEEMGYLIRKRNGQNGPIAYVNFTRDGIFVVKTWARIVDSGEEDEFNNFDDLEKGYERQDSDSSQIWEREEEFF